MTPISTTPRRSQDEENLPYTTLSGGKKKIYDLPSVLSKERSSTKVSLWHSGSLGHVVEPSLCGTQLNNRVRKAVGVRVPRNVGDFARPRSATTNTVG
ncbi:hypothetical protein E2C01_062077 [Portunus trituberculatus]|uniref:Uncharacterized protein n=1 Tax=Portunus trituberculatus TaxID=210409 RepID=A0A5B7H5I5_PORTR|nr:hypothetical protein [Portunus trituberculatus]